MISVPAAPPLRWDFSGLDSSSTLSNPTIVSTSIENREVQNYGGGEIDDTWEVEAEEEK
jgi:hypothetical protein